LAGYSQQISNYGFVDVSELIYIDTKTERGRTILDRWDRMFRIDRISPKFKMAFLEYHAFDLSPDMLIERTKSMALSNGCSPNSHPKIYIRIQYLDSIHQTSNLSEIDSLTQVWHYQLPFEKQIINARIRNLFSDDRLCRQTFHNLYLKGRKSSNALLNVNKLRNEFSDICRTQGYVPNSFDNNCLDQNYVLQFFLNVCSAYDDSEQLNFWNENLNYFIATYKAGKISNEFCYYYDLRLKRVLNLQYFGTLKNVPIKDFETFEQRKTEFEIDDLVKVLKERNRYL
jgi:hypothetical protein